ncbi:uncharacterized protein LTR77_002444 [Saxophila tyrrhenica]|uniref:Uncharacterized protein n=1 Tax=Saxophila tyrrhenica TaxID=1690608 RepID=A0AAV9PJJ5_9PEZI|nr:hypothetical protein LTR77_002444 [Saxophila tyrrhenica]
MAASVGELYDALDQTTKHYADLCPAISRPLVATLVDWLPPAPALTLSIGCGSGILEAILLHAAEEDHGKQLNLCAVEVPDCAVTHLPEDCVARVPNTFSIYDDAMLASTLIFVYPRQAKIIAMYLGAAKGTALEQIIWLGHRSDWPEAEEILLASSVQIQRVERPGTAEYELLVIARLPENDGKHVD